MGALFQHEDNLFKGPIFAAINWALMLGVVKYKGDDRVFKCIVSWPHEA